MLKPPIDPATPCPPPCTIYAATGVVGSQEYVVTSAVVGPPAMRASSDHNSGDNSQPLSSANSRVLSATLCNSKVEEPNKGPPAGGIVVSAVPCSER